MKAETKSKIEETVREILEKSDMNETTEFQIRKQASEKLGLDLSQSEYKAFVRQVVTAYLEEQDQKSKEAELEEVEEEEALKTDSAEYDDEGNPIICHLNKKRRVTVQDFKGKTLVSIREYYSKGGKELPTAKGISLTEEQWSVLKKNVSAIDKAVKKMQLRIK